MCATQSAGDDNRRRKLDLLRAAGRRARLLLKAGRRGAHAPELDSARPELEVFARQFKERRKRESQD